MNDKKIIFTIADEKNKKYAEMLKNSLRKFHKDIDFRIYDNRPEIDAFFYKTTPIIAHELFEEGYNLVIKIDADSIVTGDLDFILNSKGWDVGTVYNWNKVDPPKYGEIGIATIAPQEYYNCGFVAMRSHNFVKHWLSLCNSKHFDRMPFREQGILNILTHYGFYNVVCFDDYNASFDYSAWHGLRSKGEWNKIIKRGNSLILPQAEDKYPEMDKVIKVIHWASGDQPVKMNYKIYFQEPVINYLDYLTSNEKDKIE